MGTHLLCNMCLIFSRWHQREKVALAVQVEWRLERKRRDNSKTLNVVYPGTKVLGNLNSHEQDILVYSYSYILLYHSTIQL